MGIIATVSSIGMAVGYVDTHSTPLALLLTVRSPPLVYVDQVCPSGTLTLPPVAVCGSTWSHEQPRHQHWDRSIYG